MNNTITNQMDTIVKRVLLVVSGQAEPDAELQEMLRDPRSEASCLHADFQRRLEQTGKVEWEREKREWLEYLRATEQYRQAVDAAEPLIGDLRHTDSQIWESLCCEVESMDRLGQDHARSQAHCDESGRQVAGMMQIGGDDQEHVSHPTVAVADAVDARSSAAKTRRSVSSAERKPISHTRVSDPMRDTQTDIPFSDREILKELVLSFGEFDDVIRRLYSLGVAVLAALVALFVIVTAFLVISMWPADKQPMSNINSPTDRESLVSSVAGKRKPTDNLDRLDEPPKKDRRVVRSVENNQYDDDGDGYTDGDDLDGEDVTVYLGKYRDGLDNDEDGYVDTYDIDGDSVSGSQYRFDLEEGQLLHVASHASFRETQVGEAQVAFRVHRVDDWELRPEVDWGGHNLFAGTEACFTEAASYVIVGYRRSGQSWGRLKCQSKLMTDEPDAAEIAFYDEGGGGVGGVVVVKWTTREHGPVKSGNSGSPGQDPSIPRKRSNDQRPESDAPASVAPTPKDKDENSNERQ